MQDGFIKHTIHIYIATFLFFLK